MHTLGPYIPEHPVNRHQDDQGRCSPVKSQSQVQICKTFQTKDVMLKERETRLDTTVASCFAYLNGQFWNGDTTPVHQAMFHKITRDPQLRHSLLGLWGKSFSFSICTCCLQTDHSLIFQAITLKIHIFGVLKCYILNF